MKTLDALIVIFNKNFVQQESFMNEILSSMTVRNKPYRSWVSDGTKIKSFVKEDSQNPQVYTPMAFINFQTMLGDKFESSNIEVATFQGTQGIKGVILSHWSDKDQKSSVETQKTNILAKTSQILGILSLPASVFGIVGITLGSIAFITGLIGGRQIKKNMNVQKGERMALIGKILGGMSVLFGLLVTWALYT